MSHDRNKMDSSVASLPQNDTIPRFCHSEQSEESIRQHALYGTGMRITECLGLRVKDVDFEMNQIVVRDGKGERDRITVLPQKLIPTLKEQIQKVKNLHNMDLSHGVGETVLPYALKRKYPNAGKEFGLAT
jgi:integrase